MDGPIWNLAHRGWMAAYPENTLLAFRKALATPGCHGLELDAQLTKDGALVVIHDETVDRTTNGTGPVKDFTLDGLRALDAGGGARVPLLGEVLALAAEYPGAIVNIELKNSIEPYPGLEAAVIDAVLAHGACETVILSSFKHDSVIRCKQLAPQLQTGLLCTAAEAMPGAPLEKLLRRLRDNGIDYLHLPAAGISVEVLDVLQREQVPLLAWNADAPGVLRRLAAEESLKGVITNDPAQTAEVLAACGASARTCR